MTSAPVFLACVLLNNVYVCVPDDLQASAEEASGGEGALLRPEPSQLHPVRLPPPQPSTQLVLLHILATARQYGPPNRPHVRLFSHGGVSETL